MNKNKINLAALAKALFLQVAKENFDVNPADIEVETTTTEDGAQEVALSIPKSALRPKGSTTDTDDDKDVDVKPFIEPIENILDIMYDIVSFIPENRDKTVTERVNRAYAELIKVIHHLRAENGFTEHMMYDLTAERAAERSRRQAEGKKSRKQRALERLSKMDADALWKMIGKGKKN